MTSCNERNVTSAKIYFPCEYPIQVHQLRVKPCPRGFTAVFYWYGSKLKGPGRPPQRVRGVLAGWKTPDSHRGQSTTDPDTVPALPVVLAPDGSDVTVDIAQPLSGQFHNNGVDDSRQSTTSSLDLQAPIDSEEEEYQEQEKTAVSPTIDPPETDGLTEDQSEDSTPMHLKSKDVSPTSPQPITSEAPTDPAPNPCVPGRDTRIGYSLRHPPDQFI